MTGTGFLKTTQTVQLHLVSLKRVAFPVNIVGNNCTSAPFAQVLNGRFHTTGTGPGTSYDYWMSGTYTIPNFSNCGLNTLAVNLAIPGPGNTAKVHFTR